MSSVEKHLNSHNITFIRHDHPAVFTVAEAEEHCANIPGLACKNLFLKSKKSSRCFLITLASNKKLDLKKLESTIGEKISFGRPELLKEKLDLLPGAVSPFGLLNDTNHSVEFFIDKKVYDAEIVSFHPNINTSTLELSKNMFRKYLNSLNQKWKIVDL